MSLVYCLGGVSRHLQSWRASTAFVLSSITIALFADLFLYGFIVPIMPYMLEDRMKIDPSDTQATTSNLLAVFAAIQIVSSPLVGIVADKFPRRKGPLLMGLGAALASTALLAWSRQLWLLYVARIIQGLSATVIWVVGYATIADTVGSEYLGTALGMLTPFMNAGAFTGPLVSGTLLPIVGYWSTWSVAMAVLVLDIIMRCLMLEKPRRSSLVPSDTTAVGSDDLPEDSIDESPGENGSHQAPLVSNALNEASFMNNTENTPLLSPQNLKRPTSRAFSVEEVSTVGYFALLFRQRRFLAATLVTLTYSMLFASFEATLPLHVRAVFGWGSFPSGLMFLALEAPSIICSPLAGILRDRVGVRWPTTMGFLLLGVFMFLCGIPGDSRFPWAQDKNGKIMYAVCMAIIGSVVNLVTTSGTVESTLVIEEIEAQQPGIFGPNGGYSRLYSLGSMTFTLGTLIGPEVAGLMVDHIGYLEMSSFFAIFCFFTACISAVNLGARGPREVCKRKDRDLDGDVLHSG